MKFDKRLLTFYGRSVKFVYQTAEPETWHTDTHFYDYFY